MIIPPESLAKLTRIFIVIENPVAPAVILWQSAVTMKNEPYAVDGCFRNLVPDGERRIAWEGVSFCVPSNWELAVYKFLRRGARRIELEDEYAIRLEAEWVRGRKDLDLTRIMKRYETAAKPLTLKSDEQNTVHGLPPGWFATHFVYKETGGDTDSETLAVLQHDLVTAFYLCPRKALFCFFLIHVMPEDRENPEELIQSLARSFQDHGGEPRTPWSLFDISFSLPHALRLTQAHFDIGTKLMVFNWRRRRYFLWYFSCADMFLKAGKTPAEWACGYLNGARLLKAPVFYPDGPETIRWRRRRPFLLGHREEIATLCFRYVAGCRVMEKENRLLLWVWHYRHDDDLAL